MTKPSSSPHSCSTPRSAAPAAFASSPFFAPPRGRRGGAGDGQGEAPGRGPAEPLILTAEADRDTAARFDAFRRAHYPAHLNRVPAHITLFHRLPPEDGDAIEELLAERCWDLDPLPARAVGLVPTGRGVAIEIDSPALVQLRRQLARQWTKALSPQDRQAFAPHVTIQNKVAPAKARQTLQALETLFEPFGFTVEALRLWRYKGGPWERVARFPLGGAPD